MGIISSIANPFSQPDITTADRLAAEEFQAQGIPLGEIDAAKQPFIDQFSESWNKSRNHVIKLEGMERWVPSALGRGLRENPAEFGRALGFLIGFLRWRQGEVLDNPDLFADPISTLKPHARFLEFVIHAGQTCLVKLKDKSIPLDKMSAFQTLWQLYK